MPCFLPLTTMLYGPILYNGNICQNMHNCLPPVHKNYLCHNKMTHTCMKGRSCPPQQHLARQARTSGKLYTSLMTESLYQRLKCCNSGHYDDTAGQNQLKTPQNSMKLSKLMKEIKMGKIWEKLFVMGTEAEGWRCQNSHIFTIFFKNIFCSQDHF